MSGQVDAQLAKDHRAVCAAGDALAVAAARVCSEYDGVHRLRAALSEWFSVRSHRSPSAAGGTTPEDPEEPVDHTGDPNG